MAPIYCALRHFSNLFPFSLQEFLFVPRYVIQRSSDRFFGLSAHSRTLFVPRDRTRILLSFKFCSGFLTRNILLSGNCVLSSFQSFAAFDSSYISLFILILVLIDFFFLESVEIENLNTHTQDFKILQLSLSKCGVELILIVNEKKKVYRLTSLLTSLYNFSTFTAKVKYTDSAFFFFFFSFFLHSHHDVYRSLTT